MSHAPIYQSAAAIGRPEKVPALTSDPGHPIGRDPELLLFSELDLTSRQHLANVGLAGLLLLLMLLLLLLLEAGLDATPSHHAHARGRYMVVGSNSI
jgi:hypothetical protein